MLEIDSSNRTTILVHYYRAMVGRADVWRTRMDTTTNWAIGATAAIITFTLGNASVPHYVVFFASLMTLSFLILEARRLSFYHLWQQRVLILERGLMRPALLAGTEERASTIPKDTEDPSDDDPEASRRPVDLAAALDDHLGRTIPTMPLSKAIARRLRRIYLYLFAIHLLAWLLKLVNHPSPAASARTVVERADIGVLSGEVVLGIGAALAMAAVLSAATRGGVDRDPA